ncbi:Cof-type HAD-IIB family hydrolase [Jeotgalibacillus proteolyticus]|uniref:Cof-type HAD-IIB family hydrolase n=1 Tax=Jeotgalibacillus proteolyticus TaxID=2082395 RepID=A0A2S5GHH0_9BACL|nr:Cof-type HAD-IIB family hydrolase [Jeotgalibacillus proteolyticus]PPA72351.1 Cof-type HAD-IIB family hydrolase [Jeotgalibacillus proteolyticus]
MEKHLIVLDLDGTLLTDEKIISEKTKTTLFKAKEEGHEVMIATGRPYRASEAYYKELGLTTPIVNFNGAFVHNPVNQRWGVFHEPMDLRVVRDVVEACQDFQFHNIVAEILDDVYLHYHDEKLLDIFSFGNPAIQTGDLRTYLPASPTSVLIHADEKDVQTIRSHLDDVHAEVIDHRRWGAPWHVIELVKKGLNKAVGIRKAADALTIPQSRIIAFGDEDNDIEMLEFAGIGVAMENGIKSVQTAANEITASNNEDGIALFLEQRLKLV